MTPPATAALTATMTKLTAHTPPSSAIWMNGSRRYCEYPSNPQGKPLRRKPRSHSAATQRNGADRRARPAPRRGATNATAAATAPTQSAQYPASSAVGPQVSGCGIALYVLNVKFSHRSSVRKNAHPPTQPQPNAARGVVWRPTSSTGTSDTHASQDQSSGG